MTTREKIDKAFKELRDDISSLQEFANEIARAIDEEEESTDESGQAPVLPPLPEGAVLLPREFEVPKGKTFEGWAFSSDYMNDWLCAPCHSGMHQDMFRYCVPADSEVARINGVGTPRKTKRVPLEAKDFAGGPWVLKKKDKDVQCLVTGICESQDCIFVENEWVVLKDDLTDDILRAQGWPGDPDLEWEECFKWVDIESEVEE